MMNTQLAYSAGSVGLARNQDAARTTTARPAAGTEVPREPSTPRAAGEKPSQQAVHALVKDMNRTLQGINASLQFSQDEETGRTVIKLVDLETKEVLRQIPSEEALAIAHTLDKLKGALIRQTA